MTTTPTAATSQEWATIREACAIAGVSRRTIYNWIGLERLTWIRTAGGHRRIHIPSLFRVRGESARGE